MATSLITVALGKPFSPRISGVIRQFVLDHHAPHIHQLRAFAQRTSVIQAGTLLQYGKARVNFMVVGMIGNIVGALRRQAAQCDWQYSGGLAQASSKV